MNICEKAVSVSTRFEECSSNLKREYLIKNIDIINTIIDLFDNYVQINKNMLSYI